MDRRNLDQKAFAPGTFEIYVRDTLATFAGQVFHHTITEVVVCDPLTNCQVELAVVDHRSRPTRFSAECTGGPPARLGIAAYQRIDTEKDLCEHLI
ncbi:hypothetical protein OB08_12720 [Microbacterium sp. HJ5]